MAAACARGKHVGLSGIDAGLLEEVKEKASSKELSANAIARMYKGRVRATKVRELVRQLRA